MRLETKLPDYCLDMMNKVSRLTKAPLGIIESEVLEFDSEVKVASPRRDMHILKYRSAYRSHLEHFIVNAAYKILRVWEQPPEQRYVPATEIGRGLPLADYQELQRKLPPSFDREEMDMMAKFLFAGISRQLTSFPVDIRVEREIAVALPEHRTRQSAYLSTQVRDFLPTLDEGMKSMFPNRIYEASSAMNIAFAEQAGAIADVEPDRIFKEHESRGLAERLLEHVEAIAEPGSPGDRRLVDAWAGELSLEGWYKWVVWLDLS